MYKEYAKVNDVGVVVERYLDIDRQPGKGDVCIGTYDGEYDFDRHCNTVIADMDGHYNYKVEDGKLKGRTKAEKAQDTLPKTEMEALRETVDTLLLTMLGGGENV